MLPLMLISFVAVSRLEDIVVLWNQRSFFINTDIKLLGTILIMKWIARCLLWTVNYNRMDRAVEHPSDILTEDQH